MEKLLAIASLGQGIYGRWLSRRLISKALIVLALVIITSMMIGAVVAGGFYAAYLAMLHAGSTPMTALLAVEGLGIVVALSLIAATMICLRNLREMPQRLLQEKIPAAPPLNEMIDAFLEGYYHQK